MGVGPGTKRLIPGERVALEPGVPCWGSTASRLIFGLRLVIEIENFRDVTPILFT